MPLPFGIKLKRSRRYTVSSKSCLVTRIQLLNGEFVEFTLSVESSGQECLEGVAQRLELREVNYFSLWYFNKQNQQRWVDLEKPLKKQLDKYGLESSVYFGVVFYVPDVSQLQQEITRYQYYLQLKKDVLEGRIHCSIDQAVHLATLALQADFGDSGHFESQEVLQKFMLFPIEWIQDECLLEEATQKVALQYDKFRGLSASDAEILYMQEVEKMEGYGEESYAAKDSQGTDVFIGTCLHGVFIRHKNGKPPVIFRWNDINNMTQSKSLISLELANKEDTVQFQTEDMETSKYVCRMCIARQKFYKMNKSSVETPAVVNQVRRQSSTAFPLPKAQTFAMPPRQMHYGGQYIKPYSSSQDNLYLNSKNGYFCQSQTSLDCSPHEYNGRVCNGSVYSAHSTSSLNNPQHYLQPSPMSSNPSITGSDMMQPDYIPSHRHSALIPPSYRATPDYETVMRQKKQGFLPAERQSHSMRNLNIGSSCAYSRPDPLVYSQPEIREHTHFSSENTSQYNFHLNYSFHSPGQYQYPSERRPVFGAVSVPELTNVQLQAHEYPTPNIMKTQVYRPPPPYPSPRPANSTPDLSRHLYVSSSNPDLVTRRVHHSVQMFQEDSLPVAHSLQEVSEPLTRARHNYIKKRNSIEVAGFACGVEGFKVKEAVPSALGSEAALRTRDSQFNILLEKSRRNSEDLSLGHKKSLSDATMLVHSSGEEEEFEEDGGSHRPQLHEGSADVEQHMAVLSQPVAEHPGPYIYGQPLHGPVPETLVRQEHRQIQKQETSSSHGKGDEYLLSDDCQERAGGALSGLLWPRTKQDLSKRPVSNTPPEKGDSVDGRVQLMMKRGTKSESKKMGPLKLAMLNGLTLSRTPFHDEGKAELELTYNDDRCKVLEERLEQGTVFTEYEQVPKRRTKLEFSIAQMPENMERNRFQDVLPYDDNRVELVPTKENNTGYINASHIKIKLAGQDWNYIATQGPLASTCQDFWQMVWEHNVAIIAMVTAEEEAGMEKSFRYWPRLGSRHNTVSYGRFRITTRFRTDSGCYATTGLKIKHLLSGQERTVWHLQYTDWPDHGCPEDFKGFLSYLEEIQSVRRHTNGTTDPQNSPCPVLIHCTAGVGRTGVVILSEAMIACVEHNELLDFPTVLNLLRQQRMVMVQNISQYTFVYRVLIQYLKNSRLV